MRRKGYQRRAGGRAVLVNLRSGNALRGVIVEESARVLVLRGVTLFVPGSTPADVPGENIVAVDHVDFMQVLDPHPSPVRPAPAIDEA